MKKSTIAAIATACTMAFAAPVMAAPTSVFADMPQGHWAYGAVQQLEKDGIVSGYDGKFEGNRTMTRYEMATIVANAITKMDKANEKDKAMIQKLQQEFDKELASFDVRLAKVEKKQNVTFFFDNRIEYQHNTNDKDFKSNTKDIAMERIRVYTHANVGPDWTWDARFHQEKWNIDAPATTETAKFDRFYLTNKNIFGGKLEMGRLWYYPGKAGFSGFTGDVTGAAYTHAISDKLSLRVMDAHNNAKNINSQELTFRPNKTSDIEVYTMNTEAWGLKQRAISAAMEIWNGLAVSGEYSTNLKNHAVTKDANGYWVALQSSYRATNYNPSLYTQAVNPFKKDDHAWAVSYRHMPTNSAGYYGLGGIAWAGTTSDQSGSALRFANSEDGVNGVRVDYIYVPWQNVQLTLTYDHVKLIDSDKENNSFKSTFNFFF